MPDQTNTEKVDRRQTLVAAAGVARVLVVHDPEAVRIAPLHFAQPGITGWAQLNYPYGASERDALEKLQYDLYYVKHSGVLFDLLILMQTAEVIFFKKGSR